MLLTWLQWSDDSSYAPALIIGHVAIACGAGAAIWGALVAILFADLAPPGNTLPLMQDVALSGGSFAALGLVGAIGGGGLVCIRAWGRYLCEAACWGMIALDGVLTFLSMRYVPPQHAHLVVLGGTGLEIPVLVVIWFLRGPGIATAIANATRNRALDAAWRRSVLGLAPTFARTLKSAA